MFFIYGTGSYNRRNVVSQHAHCRECGTTTDQHSYDAMSYFTLYWLPLIPTGTKHYTRVCAECDKGLVSSVGKWKSGRKRAIDKAFEEWEQSPDSRDAALDVLGKVYRYEDLDELDELCADLRSRFPEDEEIQSEVAWVEEAFESGPKPLSRKAWPMLVVPALALVLAAPVIATGIEGKVDRAFLVNGLDREYSVLLNEERYDLDPQEVREIKLVFGSLHMKPVAGGLQFEEYTGELEADSMVAFNDSTVLINPDQTAFFTKETAFYAEKVTDRRDGNLDIYVGQPVYHLQDIDYMWQEAPAEISLSRGKRTETRRAIELHNDLTTYWRLANAVDFLEGEQLADYAHDLFEVDPDNEDLINFLFSFFEVPEIMGFLESKLDERPVLVRCHRIYQNVAMVEDPERDLIGDYRKLHKGDPSNTALTYLYARILDDEEEAMRLFRESVKGPTPCAFGYFALSRRDLIDGNFAQGLDHIRAALKLAPRESNFTSREENLLLASRDYNAVLENNRKYLEQDVLEYAVNRQQIFLLARVDRVADAEKLTTETLEKMEAAGEEAGAIEYWGSDFDLAIAEGLLDFERYSRVCEDVGAPGAHYQRCIVLGDAKGAIEYLASEDVLEFATDHLLLFALAKAGGEDAIAADQLAVAKEMMPEQVTDEFAALFEGAQAPDVGTAMRVSAESGSLFYGLAALAYLYPDNEEEFLAAADQHSWQNPLDQLLYKRLTLLNAER